MSADDDSFERRLQRIAAARGAPQPPTIAAVAPSVQGGAVRPLFWAVAALGALVLASSVMPMLSTKDSGQAPGAGLFASLLPVTSAPKEVSPLALLPPAPDGWLRVTRLDAERPEPLSIIAANWPQERGRLDKTPGYPALQAYLKDAATSGLRDRAKAGTEAVALYLDPAGHYLRVQLTFRQDALSPHADASSWIAALAATEEGRLKDGEILEHTRLAGLDVLNRTRPAGKSRAMRPIGDDPDVKNTLALTTALTDRVVLRIEGVATPNNAAALITAIDRSALQASQP